MFDLQLRDEDLVLGLPIYMTHIRQLSLSFSYSQLIEILNYKIYVRMEIITRLFIKH